MRIVIDTNVVVSALFFGGRPKELLMTLLARKMEAFASAEIITEYQETVEELCLRYPGNPSRLPLTEVISLMNIIEPVSHVDICRDPEDNKFIECAIDAKCIYIVSGDKDLLSLGKYKNVKIVTVTDFLTHHKF